MFSKQEYLVFKLKEEDKEKVKISIDITKEIIKFMNVFGVNETDKERMEQALEIFQKIDEGKVFSK